MELLMTTRKRFDKEEKRLGQDYIFVLIVAGVRDGVILRVLIIFLHRHHIPSLNLVLFYCTCI